MKQALSRSVWAPITVPHPRDVWGLQSDVRLRRGVVAGRLVRPPTRRWCERRETSYTAAQLRGVDTEGVELDVALVAYDEHAQRALFDLRSTPSGDVIVADGQIETNDWAPSSVRMVVATLHPFDAPLRGVRVRMLPGMAMAAWKFKALEHGKSACEGSEGVLSDPFGHVAAVEWIRTEVVRNGLSEFGAIDNYVWNRFPDVNFASIEGDPERARQMYRDSERKRAALRELAEMALDGNMLAAMHLLCGIGSGESDDKKAMLKGMLNDGLDAQTRVQYARDVLLHSSWHRLAHSPIASRIEALRTAESVCVDLNEPRTVIQPIKLG